MILLTLAVAGRVGWPQPRPMIQPQQIARPGQPVRGIHTLQDARGNTWDIRTNHGSIQHGTNHLYSNALYLTVNGSRFSQSSPGQFSAADKTLVIGPWTHQGLQVTRLLKLFPQAGLMRWIDVYQNTTDKPQIVNAQLRIHLNHGIGEVITSSGDKVITGEDFAAITQPRNTAVPSCLHIFRGPNIKTKDLTVSLSTPHQHRLQVHYRFTLPPKSSTAIGFLEAQNKDVGTLKSILDDFKSAEWFDDLPAELRKALVNFNLASQGGLDLERSEKTDRLTLPDGSVLLGTVSFPKLTIVDGNHTTTLPAGRIVGFAARPDQPGRVQVLLKDGQIISGSVGDQTLQLDIPQVGTQRIPLGDITRFAFRISDDRPEKLPFQGPYAVTRRGDRLGFQGGTVAWQLVTAMGMVTLSPGDLYRIVLVGDDQPLHRAHFRNGTVLTGLLQPSRPELNLRDGGPRRLAVTDLRQIEFAPDSDQPDDQGTAQLVNGDTVVGSLGDAPLTLQTAYGTMQLNGSQIRRLQRLAWRNGWVRLELWGGSTLTGRLRGETLTLQAGGTPLPVPVVMIEQITQSRLDVPGDIARQVRDLIVRLGAASYQDRTAAHEALLKLGPKILPLLKRHRDNPDPEIRQRIKRLIDELTPVGAIPPASSQSTVTHHYVSCPIKRSGERKPAAKARFSEQPKGNLATHDLNTETILGRMSCVR